MGSADSEPLNARLENSTNSGLINLDVEIMTSERCLEQNNVVI